jgi:NTP pyrophosphatase (non-canonical NTP hydrolase)
MFQFQAHVRSWCIRCFGRDIATDLTERSLRFIEEALELVQALGIKREQVDMLVQYVYSRAPGKVRQEVGGVMVTLAALTAAADIDMREAVEIELARIDNPETIEKIRERNVAKRMVVR